MRMSFRRRAAALVTAIAVAAGLLAVPDAVGSPAAAAPTPTKAVFFAADGLRQDIVERYVAEGGMPTMGEFLKKGTSASGGGLLTQAPPNTGAGWYSLA